MARRPILKYQTLKTGQTTVYTAGDDGTYQKGLGPTALVERFVDNGNGTITDRWTNLMWPKSLSKLIPGANGLVNASNQAQRARSNWANAQSYLKGDLVQNGVGLKKYICAVDHTSRADATAWAENTAYVVDDIRKDTQLGTYFKALVNHTSITPPGDWAVDTLYGVGDYVKDPQRSTYFWKCLYEHTSSSSPVELTFGPTYGAYTLVKNSNSNAYSFTPGYDFTPSEPSDWAQSTGYSAGDFVKHNGYYYQCSQSHTSGTVFEDDYGNGYWNSLLDDAFAVEVARGNLASGSYWSYVVEAEQYLQAAKTSNQVWSLEITQGSFALDRLINPTYWQSITDTYKMANDIADHPTYWIETLWAGSAGDLITLKQDNFATNVAKCEALEYAGYSDWRMANIKELLSLFEFPNTGATLLDALFDTDVKSNSRFVSSTTQGVNTANVMAIAVNTLATDMIFYAGKGSVYPALIVRNV
jgi:hypothetical protein